MKNKNSKKKPFFASFLEKQLKDPETVKGGSGIITNPTIDAATTKPTQDLAQTQKYPSDGDDDVQSI